MSWDLDEAAAIAYALAHSPVLAERADLERVADAGIRAAKTVDDPEIRVGRTSEDELLGTSRKLGVALRIKPPAPWTLDARIARARAGREAERSVSRAAARTLTAEIQELYADLAFGDATQAMLRQQLEVRRERTRVVTERAERGTATQVEMLLAAHDLADLETSISEIEREQLRARSALTALLGVPEAQPWKPVIDRGRFDAIRVGLVASTLGQRALATAPALAELAARVDAAGAEVYEETTRRLPALAWVQVERATEDSASEWSIGAAFTLPLSNVVGGKLAVARAEAQRYRRARERAVSSILQRTRDAVGLVEETGKHARELAARLAPLDTQLDALLAQERAAGGDPVKVLLLEERHLKSRRDLLEARYAHRRALIELERVVGSPP